MDGLALTFLILALVVGLPMAIVSLILGFKRGGTAKSAAIFLTILVAGLAIGTLVNAIIGMAKVEVYWDDDVRHHACTWVALGLSCGTMGFGLIEIITVVALYFVRTPTATGSSTSYGDYILLTAASNIGVGLLTSICIALVSIFGIESKNYTRKMDIALGAVKSKLEDMMSKLPDYDFRDFRVVKEGNLAYTGSVMGIKRK